MERTLGVQLGFEGYVFSNTPPSNLQQVPEAEISEHSVPIKSSSLLISMAPWLFTKLVGVVKELFLRDGLSLFQYFDDWLGDAQTR